MGVKSEKKHPLEGSKARNLGKNISVQHVVWTVFLGAVVVAT